MSQVSNSNHAGFGTVTSYWQTPTPLATIIFSPTPGPGPSPPALPTLVNILSSSKVPATRTIASSASSIATTVYHTEPAATNNATAQRGQCILGHFENTTHSTYLSDMCVWRPLYQGWLKWLVILAFLVLIALCGLLAGLTLAICGLDMTWLHIMSSTGHEKSRKMARAVTAMRQQENWLLCSLVILSVLCNESIPIILGGVFVEAWKCILLSTIMLAIFGELLPQVLIPRYALRVGYAFRHFIWCTMWIMAPLSLPLVWFFNRLSNPLPVPKQQHQERGIYNHEELLELIRYHERAEKHGGSLGHDASRIARGALYADHRTIGKITTEDEDGFQRKVWVVGSDDLEKGADDSHHDSGIFTEWSLVKMVDADEKVDEEFIRKIMEWSYSRVPVVKKVMQIDGLGLPTPCQKVIGFLYIRNLVGLKLVKGMVVKDLTILRVPFVKPNIPLLDMLNVFQVGMSRIAIVCAPPAKESFAPLSTKPENDDTLPRNQAPTWSRKYGLSTRTHVEMASLRSHINWSEVIDIPGPRSDLIPQTPIGIVTYQDVVDTILMKTSRDEYEYFGEEFGTQHPSFARLQSDTVRASMGSEARAGSLTRRRAQSGDYDMVESSNHVIKNKKQMEPLTDTSSEFKDPFQRAGAADTGSLRRRKPNQGATEEIPAGGSPTGFDGTNERYADLGLDGANESMVRDFGTELDNTFIISNGTSDHSRSRRNTVTATLPTPIAEQCRHGSSSYTTNSEGGWRSKGRVDPVGLKSTTSLFPSYLSPGDLTLLDPSTTPAPSVGGSGSEVSGRHRASSMPSPAGDKPHEGMLQTITRYASTSAANMMRMPKLRRVDPFIRDEAGALTRRKSEKANSAEYSLKDIKRVFSSKTKRNEGSQKHRQSGSVSNTSNKENSPPDTAIQSLAKLVKTRLQMTTESGETISLASTSCYGELDGADIMAESYTTRRSLTTNRQSLEIAPLFASILNNTPDAETQVQAESEVELQMPRVYIGMGRGNSKTLPRNFGGTVIRRVREEGPGDGSGTTDETVIHGLANRHSSFELGDDRKDLPSQMRETGRGGAGGKGRGGLKRSGSAPWWL